MIIGQNFINRVNFGSQSKKPRGKFFLTPYFMRLIIAIESDTVARASVSRMSFCFFFFFSDSRRIDFNSRRTGLIRPESGCIGHIGLYRPATDTADTAETGRKRPKSAEIGLKTRRICRNSDLRCVFCLLLPLFYESNILMCFLKIFLQ